MARAIETRLTLEDVQDAKRLTDVFTKAGFSREAWVVATRPKNQATPRKCMLQQSVERIIVSRSLDGAIQLWQRLEQADEARTKRIQINQKRKADEARERKEKCDAHRATAVRFAKAMTQLHPHGSMIVLEVTSVVGRTGRDYGEGPILSDECRTVKSSVGARVHHIKQATDPLESEMHVELLDTVDNQPPADKKLATDRHAPITEMFGTVWWKTAQLPPGTRVVLRIESPSFALRLCAEMDDHCFSFAPQPVEEIAVDDDEDVLVSAMVKRAKTMPE
jgi:hypothetical protein